MVNQIKAKCIQKGMQIKELCAMAQINPNRLSKWDEQIPSVDKVIRVAKVLGCSVEQLCGEDF